MSPELRSAELILEALAESSTKAGQLVLDVEGQRHAFLVQSTLAQVATAYALVSIAKSLRELRNKR